jgi:hypothetical protein
MATYCFFKDGIDYIFIQIFIRSGGNYQGQVVGISRSTGGDIKAKWWGYRGQRGGHRGQGKKVVGDIEVKWWGYRGQVMGISRSSGGDIKVKLWGYQGQGGGA